MMTKDETDQLITILKTNLSEDDFRRCCALILELSKKQSQIDIENLLSITYLN